MLVKLPVASLASIFVLLSSTRRGIHGELVLPFEARLDTRDGTAAWSMKDVEDADRCGSQACWRPA